jgi:uncharacterized protein YyaL (SSP411 family)
MRPVSERRPNRLISEKSPYLLQHAYNPVDWYPWGEAAFSRALIEDKPVFLSIGYSTCHWCHVMERESFEDPEIAVLMNETFVCVKVDREERPDVDKAYMTACQMMTGTGGWPLSIIMTPEKRPFFATTYVPRESMFGRIGMKELIPNIQKIWELQRDKVYDISSRVVNAFNEPPLGGEEEPDKTIIDEAYERLLGSFDVRHGGFGSAPRFPTPEKLTFLLRYWSRTGNENALQMVEKTLSQMRQGGIYDHVGFGFHRYSTDSAWILPHFEKMLYDQALISIAYIEAYQVTKKEAYSETVRQILEYVRREMTSSDGAFFSAEDADSEGVEGKYYLWTLDEIEKILPPREAEVFAGAYNVTRAGNLAGEYQNNDTKDNVLHKDESTDKTAAKIDMTVAELQNLLTTSIGRLFRSREMRVRPRRDDKVLTDWNGLMVVAYAKAARVFKSKGYEMSAVRATEFILNNMVHSEGRLYHRFRDGEAAIDGFLDDYAFFIWGLLELYDATLNARFVQVAMDLTAVMIDQFWDESDGGFFFSGRDAEEVVVRKKEAYDGALPSGNSVAMLCLLKLSHMTGGLDLERKANRIARRFAEEVSLMPEAHTQLLSALDFALGPSNEVVIAGDPEESDTTEMIDALRTEFLPKVVVIFSAGEGEASGPFEETLTDKPRINDRATAYVCSNYNCKQPTTDLRSMLDLLDIRPLPSFRTTHELNDPSN